MARITPQSVLVGTTAGIRPAVIRKKLRALEGLSILANCPIGHIAMQRIEFAL